MNQSTNSRCATQSTETITATKDNMKPPRTSKL